MDVEEKDLKFYKSECKAITKIRQADRQEAMKEGKEGGKEREKKGRKMGRCW